jgi:hypothetical protein
VPSALEQKPRSGAVLKVERTGIDPVTSTLPTRRERSRRFAHVRLSQQLRAIELAHHLGGAAKGTRAGVAGMLADYLARADSATRMSIDPFELGSRFRARRPS